MTPIFHHRSRYRILGQIGQGQFGRVYCAVNRQTGKFVALKDLNLQRFPTHRFLREFSYLVSLRHPNIVSCQAIEHHGTGRYLVMDYCEGGTLRDLMNAEGELTLKCRLDLIIDILLGLEHAHQHKIIHCDIKPENILLNVTAQGWTARISDFGIARVIQEAQNLSQGDGYTGSPAYMAPERIYGKYSYGTDLYSVGIMLYELIVGERPFSGLPGDLMLAHLNQRVAIPDTVPNSLKVIIQKALEKLPKRRFTSAQAMITRLRHCANLLTVEPRQRVLSPPSLLPKSNQVKRLDKTPLTAPVFHLAVQSENVFLAVGNRLYCRIYSDASLKRILIEQELFSLADPIVELNVRPQGCFVLTRSASSNSSAQYTLYCFNVSLSLGKASPEIQQVFSPISTNQFIHSIDLQGRWLALAYQTDKEEASNYLEFFKFPNLSSINSPIQFSYLPQLIPLDNRHGIALFCYDSYDKSKTYFYIFNRRGLMTKGFSLPLILFLLTSSPNSPYELLGIDANNPSLAILINLKPFKVTRIPLNFAPTFIIAQSWGYIVGDGYKEVVLLDREGFRIFAFELPLNITSIIGVGDTQLLVASWSNGQGLLSKFELANILSTNS